MDAIIKDILHFLSPRKQAMVEQLHHFCEINSGTENLLGLTQMYQTLKTAFTPIADEMEEIEFPPISTIDMLGNTSKQLCGKALFIRKRPELKRRILLTGHMDTVYGAEHPFQKLIYQNDNEINGPGVTDMKGGLVVIIQAITAFELTEAAANLGWDIFINADEEIGSPASSLFFDQIAENYQAALIYEPAMTPAGTFAKNRRGSGKLTLVATGKSAHVGRDFSDGRNAICYLAEALTQIQALNRQSNGITINVGKIAGGGALNVVPDKAVAKFDIRISKAEDEHWVRAELNNIIMKMRREGYTLDLYGNFGRPVKQICPATKRLFERIQHIGYKLGLPINWQDSGGCCDGNNLARQGMPVIDTLGVRGGNIHSVQEYILLDSLVERATLSSLLLLDLAKGGLEELKT